MAFIRFYRWIHDVLKRRSEFQRIEAWKCVCVCSFHIYIQYSIGFALLLILKKKDFSVSIILLQFCCCPIYFIDVLLFLREPVLLYTLGFIRSVTQILRFSFVTVLFSLVLHTQWANLFMRIPICSLKMFTNFMHTHTFDSVLVRFSLFIYLFTYLQNPLHHSAYCRYRHIAIKRWEARQNSNNVYIA